VSTKSVAISFPKGRIERRDEDKTKRRKRGARGPLLEAGCSLCKQNAFFFKIKNKSTTLNINLKQKRKSHLITKE
jgi:hypothetical protein